MEEAEAVKAREVVVPVGERGGEESVGCVGQAWVYGENVKQEVGDRWTRMSISGSMSCLLKGRQEQVGKEARKVGPVKGDGRLEMGNRHYLCSVLLEEVARSRWCCRHG